MKNFEIGQILYPNMKDFAVTVIFDMEAWANLGRPIHFSVVVSVDLFDKAQSMIYSVVYATHQWRLLVSTTWHALLMYLKTTHKFLLRCVEVCRRPKVCLYNLSCELYHVCCIILYVYKCSYVAVYIYVMCLLHSCIVYLFSDHQRNYTKHSSYTRIIVLLNRYVLCQRRPKLLLHK